MSHLHSSKENFVKVIFNLQQTLHTVHLNKGIIEQLKNYESITQTHLPSWCISVETLQQLILDSE